MGKNLLEYRTQKAPGVLQGVLDGKHLRQAVVHEFIPRQGSQTPIQKRINYLANKGKSAVTKSHHPTPANAKNDDDDLLDVHETFHRMNPVYTVARAPWVAALMRTVGERRGSCE